MLEVRRQRVREVAALDHPAARSVRSAHIALALRIGAVIAAALTLLAGFWTHHDTPTNVFVTTRLPKVVQPQPIPQKYLKGARKR